MNKNDLRKVWEIMKDIIGKRNSSRKQDLEILVDGSTTKDPEKLSILSINILLMLDLKWRVVLKAMSIQYHIYQRILKKNLFLISLNTKLQLYLRVLI